jgi:hypothetical protein
MFTAPANEFRVNEPRNPTHAGNKPDFNGFRA